MNKLSFSAGVLVLALLGAAQGQDRPRTGINKDQMHPDFMLPDLDGDYRRLSDFRGKKVLLIHFASW